MVDVPEREFLSHYLAALIKHKDAIKILSYIIDNQQHQPSNALHIENNAEPESQKEGPKSTKDWIISVKEKLEIDKKEDVARRKMWPKRCIYKVPRYMKNIEDKAYTPNLVSLGPYHHGEKHLENMDSHKWRAFCQILKRCKKDAKLFLNSIKEVEENVRECYEGEISMSSNELAVMMVLDGCFVLELFQGAAYGFTKLGYSENDPVFAKRDSMLHTIQRDMLMLENQIPLFVPDRLLRLQISEFGLRWGVEDLALHFFERLMPANLDRTVSSPVFNPLLLHNHKLNHLHCLHLFRQGLLVERSQLEPRRQNDGKNKPQNIIPCVARLKEAGVKFKRRNTNHFWDIEFKNGVLKIPRLLIHHGTKSHFLNLIAFEQSHLSCGNKITSYVIFMDKLINSQEDVGHLHYCGILEHWLGSDEDVADLFNQLCQELPSYMDDSYLSELSLKVYQFSDHRRNKWRASLMHNYFSNPWSITSFIAAVILLFLTSAQAFYGVYGYYKPRS